VVRSTRGNDDKTLSLPMVAAPGTGDETRDAIAMADLLMETLRKSMLYYRRRAMPQDTICILSRGGGSCCVVLCCC
jgi:hypothetical protein